MKEQTFSLPVYLLGYPIALAGVTVFYISEVLEIGARTALKLLATDAGESRK